MQADRQRNWNVSNLIKALSSIIDTVLLGHVAPGLMCKRKIYNIVAQHGMLCRFDGSQHERECEQALIEDIIIRWNVPAFIQHVRNSFKPIVVL